MSITSAELGQRLRAAREACRMTQDDVAKHLGVSRPTVTQLELGKRNVTSLELEKLSILYGRDMRDFFADDFEDKDALVALFQSEPDLVEDPAVAKALRHCVSLCRQVSGLEQLLRVDREATGVPTYSVLPPRSRQEAIEQGERIATEERRRLGFGIAPVPNLVEVLQTQGVCTGLVELPRDVSGLTMSHPRLGLLVVTNAKQHPARRRFSFAHELAHVLLDRSRHGTVSRERERHELIEVRANAFAAALLIPEEGVRAFVESLGKGKPSRTRVQVFDGGASVVAEGRTEAGSQDLQLYDIVHLAHHLDVGVLDVLHRLLNMRLLAEPHFQELRSASEAGRAKQLAASLGFPEPTRLDERGAFRHRLLSLGLEAYRRELISRAKLTELGAAVGLGRDQVVALLDEAGLGGDDEGDVLYTRK